MLKKPSEAMLLGQVFVVVLLLSGCVARYIASQQQKQVTPLRLSVSPNELLHANEDYLGDPKSPYTIVEFMDYQCPPCRRLNSSLYKMLKKHSGKVRLTVRNLPLTFHPFAKPAAIAAEAAREQNKFWLMHDAFIASSKLDKKSISILVETHHLDRGKFDRACKTSSAKTVESDLAQAQRLKLQATPSFILIKPSGEVLLCSSLNSVETQLN